MMSYMSAGKVTSPKASKATPAIRGGKVEVRTYHDGFCDSLSMDITEA